MSGLLCLQGGAELQPGCEEMDAALLAAAPGPVVVVAPYAAAPGREREIAAANASRWYEGLGARDVQLAMDEESDADLLATADLLVLPGGSPARLLDALVPYEDLLRDLLARGSAISGASAGAMVLCRWTVLPAGRPRVVPALGLAPVDLVLPHYRGSTSWLAAARGVLSARARVLGLPERSGVLLQDDAERAVGAAPCVELDLAERMGG
jgi:putative intracellular protease/amidase